MQDSGHNSEWKGPTVERLLSNGKRVWALSFRRWLVDQARKLGASVAGLALRHGVNANLLRHWMAVDDGVRPMLPTLLPVALEMPRAGTAPPVPAATQAPSMKHSPAIELKLHGACILVREGFEAESLRAVVQVLRDTAA